MRDFDHQLSFAPRLASRMTRLRFGLRYRGRRLRVAVSSEEACYELIEGDPLEIIHHGEKLKLTAGEHQTRPLPPVPKREQPPSPPGREPTRRHGGG
jgi:alpha,alpha-trehalose phosphorylase